MIRAMASAEVFLNGIRPRCPDPFIDASAREQPYTFRRTSFSINAAMLLRTAHSFASFRRSIPRRASPKLAV